MSKKSHPERLTKTKLKIHLSRNWQPQKADLVRGTFIKKLSPEGRTKTRILQFVKVKIKK